MSGFWERRRAAVAAEAEAEARAAAEAAEAAEQEALEARSDEDLLEELGLPAPDNLVDGAQLRAFLRAQLPQRLKTRALRGFWRSNPVLACLDGLNDYEDDYTLASTAGQTVKTIYQVGKGMVQPLTEALEEAPTGAEAPELVTATSDVAVPEPRSMQAEAVPVDPSETEPSEEEVEVAEPSAPAPTHRRMQFHFATTSDAESTGT